MQASGFVGEDVRRSDGSEWAAARHLTVSPRVETLRRIFDERYACVVLAFHLV